MAVLAACDQDAGTGPYVSFAGGGFIVNYRMAEVHYGFVVKLARTLKNGTRLEARFEDPAGGPSIVVKRTVEDNRRHFRFETRPVFKVKANQDYAVELRVMAAGSGKLLGTYKKTFRANIDQSALPDKPPVIGPGYHKNPALDDPPAGTDKPQDGGKSSG